MLINSHTKILKFSYTPQSIVTKGVVINYWGGRVGIISKVRAQKF